jgi:hypothetical protein
MESGQKMSMSWGRFAVMIVTSTVVIDRNGERGTEPLPARLAEITQDMLPEIRAATRKGDKGVNRRPDDALADCWA